MRILNSEKDFVIELEKYYAQSRNSLIWIEVPNMGQSVDMVIQSGDDFTLIEAKLKDWKRAIKQCLAHKLVADYIYIAVATINVSEEFKREASSLGYGILQYDSSNKSINQILKAKRNSYWKPQRAIFERKINNPQNYESATLDVF